MTPLPPASTFTTFTTTQLEPNQRAKEYLHWSLLIVYLALRCVYWVMIKWFWKPAYNHHHHQRQESITATFTTDDSVVFTITTPATDNFNNFNNFNNFRHLRHLRHLRRPLLFSLDLADLLTLLPYYITLLYNLQYIGQLLTLFHPFSAAGVLLRCTTVHYLYHQTDVTNCVEDYRPSEYLLLTLTALWTFVLNVDWFQHCLNGSRCGNHALIERAFKTVTAIVLGFNVLLLILHCRLVFFTTANN